MGHLHATCPGAPGLGPRGPAGHLAAWHPLNSWSTPTTGAPPRGVSGGHPYQSVLEPPDLAAMRIVTIVRALHIILTPPVWRGASSRKPMRCHLWETERGELCCQESD